jgi:hypothetical protein
MKIINNDLKRSFLQYKKNKKLKYIKLSWKHRVIIFLFSPIIVILPLFFILNLFFKERKKNNSVHILKYSDKNPYILIYNELVKNFKNDLIFIDYKSFYLPIVPKILLIDYYKILLLKPIFFFCNIDFFLFLVFKLFKYIYFIKFYNIEKLIVLQEYSFYMSYLTRIMEYENKSLFNIMHGIPGKTYNSFRFTKCFIWGEYFKKIYLRYGAYKNQFVVSGSIYHNYLLKNYKNNNEQIDIVYIMAGKMNFYQEVIEVLEKLSIDFTIRIKQHPRHYIKLDTFLIEDKRDIITIIDSSKIIIGHYTTGIFDAYILNKKVISYMKGYEHFVEYMNYLSNKNIVYNKIDLEKLINFQSNQKCLELYNNDVIDSKINCFKTLKKEIFR